MIRLTMDLQPGRQPTTVRTVQTVILVPLTAHATKKMSSGSENNPAVIRSSSFFFAVKITEIYLFLFFFFWYLSCAELLVCVFLAFL